MLRNVRRKSKNWEVYLQLMCTPSQIPYRLCGNGKQEILQIFSILYGIPYKKQGIFQLSSSQAQQLIPRLYRVLKVARQAKYQIRKFAFSEFFLPSLSLSRSLWLCG